MSDLISRKAAIDAVVSAMIDGADAELVEGVMELLPSAQPEREKGEWILYDKRFPWRTDYKCTNCGNYLDFSGVNGGRGEANFCPSCGADMRGEQDEQENNIS